VGVPIKESFMTQKMHPWILSTCVALLLAGGLAPARAGVSDAWVSTKVKMLLMNSPRVSGFPIDVDTDEGRVTLHGKVSSKSEKAEADRIARAGTGVMSVRNLLQVVPDSQRKSVEVADGRLTEDVNAALKAEPALANSSVQVKSVNKGVVLLEGKAATLSDHLLALELASVVPGVRQVASEVESPDEYGDREVWYNETPADTSRGNAVTDAWITAQTKLLFMTDAAIPASDINPSGRRHVVRHGADRRGLRPGDAGDERCGRREVGAPRAARGPGVTKASGDRERRSGRVGRPPANLGCQDGGCGRARRGEGRDGSADRHGRTRVGSLCRGGHRPLHARGRVGPERPAGRGSEDEPAITRGGGDRVR
jgi:osmotically-inducible protein OsmY